MIEWLWNGLVGFILGAIPTWVWVIAAGVGIGWAWKTFGWQGVAGGVMAVITFGAYRQGWRDRGAGKKPLAPIEDFEEAIAPPKRKTTRRNFGNPGTGKSLIERLTGRKE